MRRQALVTAWLVTGVVDGLFATVQSVFFYRSTFDRLWQGVASTVAGPEAIGGGPAMTALGIAMHVGVAFAWSAVFLVLFTRSRWLRGLATSRYGVLKVAAVYGPAIWMVMSLAVIPMLTGRPPAITTRWWIQLAGHFPFVGLPIVASIRGRMPA